MRRIGAVAVSLLLAVAACRPATAHGASRGLHLHLDPDHAALAAEVEVAADCAEPMTILRIAFVGQEPFQVKPEEPAKRILVRLPVPETATGATINVQAEVRGATGRNYRASAILRLTAPAASPTPSPAPRGR